MIHGSQHFGDCTDRYPKKIIPSQNFPLYGILGVAHSVRLDLIERALYIASPRYLEASPLERAGELVAT